MTKTLPKERLGNEGSLADFTQLQYEKYQSKLRELVAGDVSAAVANGAVVRSAIHAGFLTGVEADAIDGMSPRVVNWLTAEIHMHVTENVNVPKEWLSASLNTLEGNGKSAQES